jgi:hypothetical protein
MKCWWISLLLVSIAAGAEPPLRLHPDNPHYFQFRGKPAVLITSGEHYGAVLNGRFDYRKYLETLAADRLNLTRIFSGMYREVPGSFNITRNTLAPEEADFVQPFKRLGPRKYDLASWNEDYFRRLRDFMGVASKQGIVVEMTLFTTYYNDTHWNLSPLNAKNNVQGIGKVKSTEVLTLTEPELVRVQESFVRKIVTELKDFDNLYFEICNEPYFHGVTMEWQRRMAQVIRDTDPRLLISLNIANNQAEVKDADPNISIFNFHYARPPRTIAMNWGLAKPIGMNETGFDGSLDAVYRIQGWDFLMSGGALYNNLDYSFAVGHEDGTFAVPGNDPGGGSARLRKQLRILHDFMDAIAFTTMPPRAGFFKAGVPENASARALGNVKGDWAIYLHHGRLMEGYRPSYIVGTRKTKAVLEVDLPAGNYEVEWWNTRQQSERQRRKLSHEGGTARIETPEYTEDIAAIIRRQ